MPTLTINFVASSPPPSMGYIVKYRKQGTITYSVVNPTPLSPPIIISGLDPGVYEGTIQSVCSFQESAPPVSFTSVASSCNIGVDINISSTGPSTASATAVPLSGVGPFTYSWTNGQTTQTATGLIKNTQYSVTVTDSLGCFITRQFTPNIEILTGLKLEMMYFDSATAVTTDPFYPRLCTSGHICNRARFEVFTNSVSQGIANLNNNGGTSVADGTIDDQNRAPQYPNYNLSGIGDRYWSKTLSGADAAAIAGPSGTVNITLRYTGVDNNPHSSASWIRISKEDGSILSSTCVNTFTGYTFDPYA